MNDLTIREVLQRMKLFLTMCIAAPIVIMAINGIAWPNDMLYGVITSVVVEIPLIICYVQAKQIHKKKVEDSKAYEGVKDYIETEIEEERKRRREKFIRESNKYNKFDSIYFGREVEPETFHTDSAKPSAETYRQNIVHYIEGMDRNPFGSKVEIWMAKKNLDVYRVCKKAHLNRDIMGYLADPSFQISKKNALQFCFALKLSIGEALELLEQAGYTLDKLREFDCAMCFFLENNLHEIEYINYQLYALGFEEF